MDPYMQLCCELYSKMHQVQPLSPQNLPTINIPGNYPLPLQPQPSHSELSVPPPIPLPPFVRAPVQNYQLSYPHSAEHPSAFFHSLYTLHNLTTRRPYEIQDSQIALSRQLAAENPNGAVVSSQFAEKLCQYLKDYPNIKFELEVSLEPTPKFMLKPVILENTSGTSEPEIAGPEQEAAGPEQEAAGPEQEAIDSKLSHVGELISTFITTGQEQTTITDIVMENSKNDGTNKGVEIKLLLEREGRPCALKINFQEEEIHNNDTIVNSDFEPSPPSSVCDTPCCSWQNPSNTRKKPVSRKRKKWAKD